jgi:myo-inositol-1(or 4)-monophosphatase
MEEDDLLREAVRIARDAGTLLLELARTDVEIRHKGEVDLVTRADRASEDLILGAVRSLFPGHGILSEESGTVRGPDGGGWAWVVDPLDGTTNYAHGLPIWSVSIGILRDGEPRVAVVLDPTRNECFTAVRGRGARLDGTSIRVSEARALEHALLVTGFPYDVRRSTDNNLDHFARFATRARAVRRLGSAALDLAYVACGRFDGFWELKLHPWDVAAGWLLVEEAGGVVTRFAGEPFDLRADEIVAGPEALVASMYEVLALGRREPASPGGGAGSRA